MIRRNSTATGNGTLARVLTRQHVRAVYQPIVNLRKGAVVGYEALARPANIADDGSVEDFFRSARQEGAIRDLEWLCRRAALHGAKAMAAGPFLSLNLNADALQRTEDDAAALRQLLAAAGRAASSVVIEVVRPPSIPDVTTLMALLEPYRRTGARIALAGVDELDEPLLLAAESPPEFIKLARPMVARLRDAPCRGFAERCAHRAARGGPVAVAEGIETDEIATLVLDSGLDLGQGYLLGKPASMGRDGRLHQEPAPQDSAAAG